MDSQYLNVIELLEENVLELQSIRLQFRCLLLACISCVWEENLFLALRESIFFLSLTFCWEILTQQRNMPTTDRYYTELIISLEQNEECIQFSSNVHAYFHVCHCKRREFVNINFFLNLGFSFPVDIWVSKLSSSLSPHPPTKNMPDIRPLLWSLFPPHSPDSLLHNRHLIRRDWLL